MVKLHLQQGFKLTVAQSPTATRTAGWVPKNYILLAQFATMTSLKGLLFFSRFLVDYTNISPILSVIPSSLQNFMSQLISDNF